MAQGIFLFFIIVLGFQVAPAEEAQKVPAFEAGDRVVFIGDSLTHGGMYRPYIETFYALRFPDRKVITLNAGISGDTAKGGSERTSVNGSTIWQRDIRSFAPTVAVVMFGMNDAVSAHFQNSETKDELRHKCKQTVEWFRSSYGKLLRNLAALDIHRVILLKSSPYDQTLSTPDARENLLRFGKGKNDLIIEMAQEVVDEASVHWSIPVIDFNAPLLAINRKMQALDPTSSIIGLDRVHPGSMGHLAMAYTFLKAQQLEGPVASAHLNLRHFRVISQNNCTVRNLHSGPSGIRFDYQAKALPFPKALYQPIQAWVPFEEDFNQENLILQGLPEGEYQLLIDNCEVSRFRVTSPVTTINLATLDRSPHVKQAQAVWEICRERAKRASASRAIVWCDQHLGKVEGLDQGDTEACVAEVHRILSETAGLSPYVIGLYEYYLAHIRSYSASLAEIEALGLEMYQLAQPRVMRFTLQPLP